MFFVESNGEEHCCPDCGGMLKYRDSLPRIMRGYNGDKAHVIIERRRCLDCNKLHRCLPPQLTKFKHFMAEIIEDTVDGCVNPEDPEDPHPGGELIESPSLRTVDRWKEWIRRNTPRINGYLKAAGHSILGFSTQFLKSGISLLEELRKEGGGWLSAVQCVIYNSGGFLEPWYPGR